MSVSKTLVGVDIFRIQLGSPAATTCELTSDELSQWTTNATRLVRAIWDIGILRGSGHAQLHDGRERMFLHLLHELRMRHSFEYVGTDIDHKYQTGFFQA